MVLTLDEQMALKSVLEFVSVKDLLTSAMNDLASKDSNKAQDSADTIFKAMQVFL